MQAKTEWRAELLTADEAEELGSDSGQGGWFAVRHEDGEAGGVVGPFDSEAEAKEEAALL